MSAEAAAERDRPPKLTFYNAMLNAIDFVRLTIKAIYKIVYYTLQLVRFLAYLPVRFGKSVRKCCKVVARTGRPEGIPQ